VCGTGKAVPEDRLGDVAERLAKFG